MRQHVCVQAPTAGSICAFVLFAMPAWGQGTPFDTQRVPLHAMDVKITQISAGSPSTILNILVDASTTEGNSLDVLTEAGITISLIQPGNVEVNAANAASLGYQWSTYTPDPSQPIVSPIQFPGYHTLIKLPPSAPAGTYGVKANASQTAIESGMVVSYFFNSKLQAGITSKAPTYRLGETAVLTALLFDDVTPVTGATATARLMAATDVSTQVQVGNIQLLSSTTPAPNTVQETYSASLVNTGPAITRATAAIQNPATGPIILSGTLSFGEVPANATAAALNTFAIERKTTEPFSPSTLVWSVESLRDMGQVTLTDSGPEDAQAGDGLYTGTFVPTTAGRYTASLRATGTSAGGAAFSRIAATSFQAVSPSASFVAFQDQAIDDDGNGLTDRVVVTASLSVATAGNYKMLLRLKASNGNTLLGSARASLSAGTAQISAVFTSKDIIRDLGVNGPFERSEALLFLEKANDEEVLADSRTSAGSTAAWPLTTFDRGVFYLTGQNSVAGVSTDGAPLYDVLRTTIGVYFAPGGRCSWSGGLSNSWEFFEYANGSGTLTPGLNFIQLDFSGANIARRNGSRPLKIGDFGIQCGPESGSRESLGETMTPNTAFRPGSTDFSLSAVPATVSLAAGTALTVRMTVSSAGPFVNAIESTVSGLPLGVSADVQPPSLLAAPGSFIVHFHAMPTAVPGSYQVVLSSSGGGVMKTLAIPIDDYSACREECGSLSSGSCLHGEWK